MLRAYDVMTRAVASVTPQTPVRQVSTIMRDLNIGDVLVLEEGKLRGIVTDRDLVVNVLTNGADTKAPIERYMTTDVVTGSPDWSMEQIAQVMGEHQIRRLPIVQNDHVIGIVSLGDVALHANKHETVGQSLKHISEVTRTKFQRIPNLNKFFALAIPFALGAGVILFANSNSGRRVREQITSGELTDQARAALRDTVQTLQDPKTRQAVLDAVEATGLPAQTRHALQEGVNTLSNSRVVHAGDDMRRQVLNAPQEFTRRFQKPKRKRFLIA